MKRNAIVSGGADGIGKAIVTRLLDDGFSVCAFDIVDEKIAAAEEEFKDKEFFAIKCNALDEEAVKEAFNKAMEKFDKLDVLVNVVGGSMAISQPVDQIEFDGWMKVLALNLNSTFLCTREAVKLMRENGYGRIVNLSSMAGRSRSVFGGAPYATAKAGILGFTRQTSKDLAPIGITINAVAPGTVMSGDRISGYWDKKTEEDKKLFFSTNPSGRLGDISEVAACVAFLCREDSGYINGACIDVNGGMWVG